MAKSGKISSVSICTEGHIEGEALADQVAAVKTNMVENEERIVASAGYTFEKNNRLRLLNLAEGMVRGLENFMVP